MQLKNERGPSTVRAATAKTLEARQSGMFTAKAHGRHFYFNALNSAIGHLDMKLNFFHDSKMKKPKRKF